MAGTSTPTPSRSGGKRTVDAQLTMVPFIDLLSVLIVFLLMASVWSHVARLDTRATPLAPTNPIDVPPPPPALTVHIRASGYAVARAEATPQEIARAADGYDREALGRVLASERARVPDGVELIVKCDDLVPYEEMVGVMDVAVAQGLSRISIDGT